MEGTCNVNEGKGEKVEVCCPLPSTPHLTAPSCSITLTECIKLHPDIFKTDLPPTVQKEMLMSLFQSTKMFFPPSFMS